MTKEEVFLNLNQAREIWSHKSTANPENILKIIKGLGYILVHAPEDTVHMVEAHILEAERRLYYAEIRK